MFLNFIHIVTCVNNFSLISEQQLIGLTNKLLHVSSLENSAAATGLEKVSFHSNPKERQCQRMLKLLHNYTHLTHWQSNAQNSPSQASTVSELNTSRCSSWIQKRQRNQKSNCQHQLDHQKAREFQKNIYFCFFDYAKAFDCVDHHKLWKTLNSEMGIPDHLTCLLRNLYAGQEATVRTRHGKMDWFQIRRGVQQAVFSFVMLIPSFEKHSFSFSCSILSLILIGQGIGSVQFSPVAQSCLTLCNPMNPSTPGFPVPTPRVYSDSYPSSQ